jgi:hypothetical protein
MHYIYQLYVEVLFIAQQLDLSNWYWVLGCNAGEGKFPHYEGPIDVRHGCHKRLQVYGAKSLHPPGHSSPELFAHYQGTGQGCQDCRLWHGQRHLQVYFLPAFNL